MKFIWLILILREISQDMNLWTDIKEVSGFVAMLDGSNTVANGSLLVNLLEI